jgi:antitoxin HicB
MAKKEFHKKVLHYTALFTPAEEGGFIVEVPALIGCISEGDTLEEAKKNIQEAIELYLETLQDRGLPIPEDEEPNFFRLKIEVPIQFA